MKVLSKLTSLLAGSVIVAGAVVAGASVAQADKYVKDKVVYERPHSWSGFYFGVHSGWVWADIESNFVPGPASDSVDFDSPAVGLQIGLQHQFGQLVVGVEGSATWALKDDYANVICPNPARLCGKRFEDVLTIGPRLGWAMGKWMPYVTGGYANAAFAHRSHDHPVVGNFLVGHDRFGGWYIGGGLEWAVAGGWTVGIDYRHYEFEDQIFRTNTPGGVLSADVRSLEPTLDEVSLRVSWKFGRPEPKPLK